MPFQHSLWQLPRRWPCCLLGYNLLALLSYCIWCIQYIELQCSSSPPLSPCIHASRSANTALYKGTIHSEKAEETNHHSPNVIPEAQAVLTEVESSGLAIGQRVLSPTCFSPFQCWGAAGKQVSLPF
mmetsp:Transcript_43068/g.77378  ORF Transcript_43068/g.77378 Transcript_43068/m.77378 type:complete len:127 (-) Transcript_43068:1723-2103(-)